MKLTLARLLAASALITAPPAIAQDKAVVSYVTEANGVRIEITAPRADIVRVRAARGDLPADESWAVPQDIRAHGVPLAVSEMGSEVSITTADVVVKLNRTTLAITITDKSGQTILADAPGTALAFDNGGFRIRKAMPADGHYFGLGDKTGSLDRRGNAYTFWNTDAFGYGPATDPIYKSIPFLIGADEKGHTFGFFMDNHWRGFADIGKSERNAFAFGAEGGPVDYYVMAGPNPKDIVQDYTWLTGKQPLTPLWALGFQQSRWSYMTQDEATGIVDRARTDKVPLDVLWLDIDYQDRNRPFTVDSKAYPDLAGFVKDMRAKGIHVVVITDLHIANAPNQGYKAYDSGTAAGIFLRKADGSTYVAPVWPGDSVFPDFSREKARDWWGQQYKMFTDMGVSGFWNDMNEPAIFNSPTKTMPIDNIHRIEEPGFVTRDASHAEMHNVYGMLNTRATYDGVLKLQPNLRPFVMTRAGYAGGQRYAATWTGDNASSWAHLKLSTLQLVSLGLGGFAYAGDDIGGFCCDAPSADLLTRWIQVGAFNPIFRDHYQKGKPPQEVWVHGPDHLAIRRKAIEERYRLMPYLYGLAEENSRTGLPIMRPVFLEFPGVIAKGERVGGTEDMFMFGPSLLVAPPNAWESPAPYSFELPGEGWYDYWTGAKLGSAKVTETPRLERLPVFVRPGAIIPRQPLVQSTSETPSGPLELAVYPGADCAGSFYFDDGVSFAYRTGQYLRQNVRCDATSISFDARQGKYRPWWTQIRIVVHGWTTATPKVMLGRKAIPAEVDAEKQTLTFTLPDQARAATIRFAR